MDFWNENSGIVIGDPLDNRFLVARTFDGGNSWQEIPYSYRPAADSGEYCFAASGTNVCVKDKDEAVFVSGGKISRFFSKNPALILPFPKGKSTLGANSIAVWKNRNNRGGEQMIVVGGDYTLVDSDKDNCYYSLNGGKKWLTPEKPPKGYRSCVDFFNKKIAVACGPNGIDITFNSGKTWKYFSEQGFFVCKSSPHENTVFLAGPQGKIGVLIFR
ncbi:MAG: hypothetical protein N2747_06020 [Chitinophagaceae bacterium]|nr:hypothetical protein [Chitinophagaceae bacterium]